MEAQFPLLPYRRLKTREVRVGNLILGNGHPIRLQTMTTTDTMDTAATVAQTIRCVEAGAELVRITAPSKREAENLQAIKNELRARGYDVPLVADIHFTPNAAEIAARIVEKVRINPGNYIDKKKFETIDYTDARYAAEIERIQKRFSPLVKICKEHGTAMRIGTNHGSLSDRIMSRYGDTPIGMVESAMEFLRIARHESFHNIVLSMKSSNPQVMVQAYRLLVQTMQDEFGECYPLHLGVTEAGDGDEGRIKSAVGMGALLDDGLGDTVRVSLTEEPELEIPVCRELVARYPDTTAESYPNDERAALFHVWKPTYIRRGAWEIQNIGGRQVPVVVSDLSHIDRIEPQSLEAIGYTYDPSLDKWQIGDQAADFILIQRGELDFKLPGTLKVIVPAAKWRKGDADEEKYFPLFTAEAYRQATQKGRINFVHVTPDQAGVATILQLKDDRSVVYWLQPAGASVKQCRKLMRMMVEAGIQQPVILACNSTRTNLDAHLIHFAVETGALLLEGYGDGISLRVPASVHQALSDNLAQNRAESGTACAGRYAETFLNATAFSILQATRCRISKTEYISCPSCGRTLFDLQETTARIRAVTHHLKGVKIAVMGCIVNGPGEMADADFGYVGSGVGKVTLYRGKEVVKRAVNSDVAVDELVQLLKDSGAWVEPAGQSAKV